MKKIIFTDLDGTLLHPETCSFEEALPALDLIRKKGIPLVLVSSKTKAELEVWRRRLNNGHPFVVENGGGIYIPEKYFPFTGMTSGVDGYTRISLGTPYPLIRDRFKQLREKLKAGISGFGDMSPDQVALISGLTREEAKLAKQREFSEPFFFTGGADERFLRALEGEKLRWTQGQFFHLMGNHHKGKAVEMLCRLYRIKAAHAVTIGIGDGLNDLPFLLAVDRPVLIKNRSGKHDSRVHIPGLLRTAGMGPAGWNEAVLELLNQSERVVEGNVEAGANHAL